VFTEIIRSLGLSLSMNDLLRPVTFDDALAPAMRRVLARYGFDLPPLTVGELYGLLEYCDRLDALTGSGVFAQDQLPQWRQMSYGLRSSDSSPCQRALELYALDDSRGLRALHREQRTLVHLGRAYLDAVRVSGR
jgi:hypothetical protein